MGIGKALRLIKKMKSQKNKNSNYVTYSELSEVLQTLNEEDPGLENHMFPPRGEKKDICMVCGCSKDAIREFNFPCNEFRHSNI